MRNSQRVRSLGRKLRARWTISSTKDIISIFGDPVNYFLCKKCLHAWETQDVFWFPEDLTKCPECNAGLLVMHYRNEEDREIEKTKLFIEQVEHEYNQVR